MKTIVYQSFRTDDVPPWVESCLRSARDWAAAKEFEYRFFDDAFFEFCPDWYRDRVERNILLMSDLARLVAARRLLDEGFEQAIWIDADLLIFAPRAFEVDAAHDETFAFNTELWVNREQGRFMGWWRVNNALCTFARGNAFLDFYIDACQRIVRKAPPGEIDRLSVGTNFLTGLHQLSPLPLLRCAGTFNPILMEHLAHGQLEPLRAYRKYFGRPIGAANLCGSFRGEVCQGVKMEDSIYDGTIAALLGPAGRETGQ